MAKPLAKGTPRGRGTKVMAKEERTAPKARAKAKAKVEKPVLQEKATHKKATAKGTKEESMYVDPTPR